ncbi:MAG: site-specific integrase [Clostridia bacterium]|nr:site-specific integrase [Clostridia bacterium]
MEKQKSVSSSVHAKNGRLYAVIWYRDEVTGKQKPVWRALRLDENSRPAIVNRRLREVTNDFEEELNSVTDEEETTEDFPLYDYLAEWLVRIKNSLQLTTFRGYTVLVNGKIKQYFTERPTLTVKTIKAKDIEKFYAYLYSSGMTGSTVLHYHALLHKAFTYAFKDELIEANPFDRVERPKKNPFHGESYSEEELRALLNITKNDPIYPAIVLAGCLGLRRSEALGARWSRVNFEENTILIDTKIIELKEKGKNEVCAVEEMKNKSSRRTLTLPRPVLDMLIEQKGRIEVYRNMFKGAYNREYEDYICVDQLGNMFTPSYVTNHFACILRNHGMKRIRFHDLRHTFASLLLNNNKPLIEVSNFLGHSDIGTTANIYAHLDKASKQGCADTISEIIDRKENNEGA